MSNRKKEITASVARRLDIIQVNVRKRFKRHQEGKRH